MAVLRDKQRQLDALLKQHDADVRQLFHLDKYTSLLDYDPVAARALDSTVFTQFADKYDLYTNTAPRPTRSKVSQAKAALAKPRGRPAKPRGGKRKSAVATHAEPPTKRLKFDGPLPPNAYTAPEQLPLDQPKFDGDLDALLDSLLEASHQDSLAEALTWNRIHAFKQTGLLGIRHSLHQDASYAPPDLLSFLLSDISTQHAQLSHLESRKSASFNHIKAGLTLHFDKLSELRSKDAAAEERRLKGLARNLAKEMRKKWKLAAQVFQARLEKEEKEEKARLGREKLDEMLELSRGFLEKQKEGLNATSDEDEDESEIESDHLQHTVDQDDIQEALSAAIDQENDNTPSPSPSATSADISRSASIQADDFTPAESEADALQDYTLEHEMQAADSDETDVEMNDLQKEGEMPIEQLLAKYNIPPPDIQRQDTPASEDSHREDEEKEAELEAADADMENDMEVEEKLDEEEDNKEMNGLQGDAERPIEDILREYGIEMDMLGHNSPTPSLQSDSQSEPQSEPESEVEQEEEVRQNGVDHSSDSEDEEGVLKVRIPFLLRGTLRPYQKAGLEWLAGLYMNNLNGILADEMGLGKTIQTISLLAWLACEQGNWGPHLVIVPTSVLLNWEMEFKKFLPGFKILTYYGSQKERKEKRVGWATENTFNVCIASYQTVLSDQAIIRRKRWKYMILDEAHHIKNFRSQRWQVLLGFTSERRLLLTGTPLQNNIMELWSLLYFLMPHGITNDGQLGPFANHKQFQEWFSNPMDKAVETGSTNDSETRATVSKLHTVLRPYLLRRLKADVEKEMPGKFEHIVWCRLSKRQRFLYDDFMARAQTKETLASGNFMSIINALMQLRKVCNHPDLFEVRPIVTSFAMHKNVASDFDTQEFLVRRRLLDTHPLDHINPPSLDILLNGDLQSHYTGQVSKNLDASTQLEELKKSELTLARKDTLTVEGWKAYYAYLLQEQHNSRIDRMISLNKSRCTLSTPSLSHETVTTARKFGQDTKLLPADAQKPLYSYLLPQLIHSHSSRSESLKPLISRFAFVTPNVTTPHTTEIALPSLKREHLETLPEKAFDPFHLPSVKLSIAFPDPSLLQYDCGKLQELDLLIRRIKPKGSRMLIFTQMTKVLDILELFLSFHGLRYLRLDGATKVEDRQVITERFNRDDRIFAFISSTRAGGLGINLTGADTVVFYDQDWCPSMDKQCQDRAHRIGQTRTVHIYRFVCTSTIEENMLHRANQKRLLESTVITSGDFTTDYLTRLNWKDMLPTATDAEVNNLLARAGDEEDVEAARVAQGEAEMDDTDFLNEDKAVLPTRPEMELDGQEEEEDEFSGTVDGYMLKFVEEDWDEYFIDFI